MTENATPNDATQQAIEALSQHATAAMDPEELQAALRIDEVGQDWGFVFFFAAARLRARGVTVDDMVTALRGVSKAWPA